MVVQLLGHVRLLVHGCCSRGTMRYCISGIATTPCPVVVSAAVDRETSAAFFKTLAAAMSATSGSGVLHMTANLLKPEWRMGTRVQLT